MRARTGRRADARTEQNRHTVNRESTSRNQGGLSRTEWSALDRNERKKLTEAAQAAQVRVDDGEARPGDDVLAGVFEAHCQDAQRFCLICGDPSDGWECTSCTVAHDVEVARSADA